jgi:hypothetical protein
MQALERYGDLLFESCGLLVGLERKCLVDLELIYQALLFSSKILNFLLELCNLSFPVLLTCLELCLDLSSFPLRTRDRELWEELECYAFDGICLLCLRKSDIIAHRICLEQEHGCEELRDKLHWYHSSMVMLECIPPCRFSMHQLLNSIAQEARCPVELLSSLHLLECELVL